MVIPGRGGTLQPGIYKPDAGNMDSGLVASLGPGLTGIG
jgi:hypothetical protein